MAKTAKQIVAQLEAQLAAVSAKLEVARIQASREVNPGAIVAGAVIDFEFGRSETRRVYTGTVLGRRDPAEGEKGGSWLKVSVGEGFEAALFTVSPSNVLKVHGEEAEGEETVDQDAVGEFAPEAAVE